ncbi:alpha/beta fold hydrolase [Actinoplanes sp. CA-131856]
MPSIDPVAVTPQSDLLRKHSMVRVGARDIFLTDIATAGGAQKDVPVLLLHGGGPGTTGESNFSRNIDALAGLGYRVLVPDMPGYGNSSKAVERTDPFGDLAAFVRGLLDALGLEAAHMVGHSYGGAAALRVALDSPQRVARMALLAPGGIGTTRALPTSGLNALLNFYGGAGPSRAKLRSFIDDYLVVDAAQVSDEAFEARYQASIVPEVVADPPLRRPRVGPGMLGTLWKMDFSRARRRVAACTVPAMVVWGSDDRVNRPTGGWWLARTMPNCDLHLIARGRHWVQYEQADQVNAMLAAWLAGSQA